MPKVPTQLHFGEKDASIPLSDVEDVKTKRPDVDVFVYPGAASSAMNARATTGSAPASPGSEAWPSLQNTCNSRAALRPSHWGSANQERRDSGAKCMIDSTQVDMI